ncbi:putative membrane protein (TIGR04086 family) [Brevibacillus aydinogluensis]|uniref:TIGR04086 family membrane protein n=1 Tax=Brevibacillus TaxID=55080 RepID=UPI000E39FF0A|nr:TIGR04086 family membrane protein [Brevibacillus aydinogluensis]MBR8660624.1 TIGR04086 family membrane protein [Brevibacillus sp. NL20B1]MDT3414405.1 putative membrane protein (TIGR04086 family) [Brevibacillus aydinogluensis]REK64534.1 MAG: TIGR04086 family membrane protein [Brevibacillus sp.]
MRSATTSVFTGLLYTLGLVLTGALLAALLLSFTNIRESTLPYFTYTINALGLLLGGYVTGRRCGGKGWYYGGLTGLSYFLLVLLIGFLGFDAAMQWSTLLYLLGAFVTAAVGGIFGVNSVSKRY